MNISIILGTRPEIIKMSPIIRLFEKKSIKFFVLHTGQHYSYLLDKIFFSEFGLHNPKYTLDVGSANQGEQTGKMIGGIERILLEEKPDLILVQGETNIVLAGAIASVKIGIIIGRIQKMMENVVDWPNPFGDGKTADRIINILGELK
jgi:UDP-N-acetylglucosamine 2-epimerase (non-hydrolysing)